MAGNEGTRAGIPRIADRLPAGDRLPAEVWRRLLERAAALRRNRRQRPDGPPRYATILVERNDSLATVCGKLDTTRLSQVAVLVPRGNAELSRAIGMRLLMRHAELTGKDIVLVGGGLAIRQRARAEGQAHVRRERSVRFDAVMRPALQLGGLDLGLPSASVVGTSLILGVLAVLAFIAIFWYLPVATVTLYPPSTPVDAEQLVTLDTQQNHLNASGFVIPAVRQQMSVSRTVFVPTTGDASPNAAAGARGAQHTVADADSRAAQALAPAALRDQALHDLQSRYGSAQVFYPETAQVQVRSIEQPQQSGDAADFLEVTYRGSVSMLGVQSADLHQVFVGLLQRKLPRDRQLIDSSLTLRSLKLGPFDRDADKLPVQVRAEAGSTQAFDTSHLKSALEGKSARDAVQAIGLQMDSARRPELRLTPGWVPWLPHTAGHIHFDIRVDIRAGGAAQ